MVGLAFLDNKETTIDIDNERLWIEEKLTVIMLSNDFGDSISMKSRWPLILGEEAHEAQINFSHLRYC